MINNLEKATGSSPLARGTLRGDPGRGSQRRFIPAGAGNTPSRRMTIPGWAVHPRWRGEHAELGVDAVDDVGSSPLARGTPNSRRSAEIELRFIPAGAGNTMAFFIATPPPTVHPRWRGEHPLMATINPWKRGSSPLARGTLVLTRGDGLPRRFIPAGAGNTSSLAT